MEVWELLVREQVRETFTSYSSAGDGGRLDDLAAQFAEDGTLSIPPREPATGREAIAKMLTEGTREPPPGAHPGQRPFLRHFTTNIHFRAVERERVETSAYFLVLTAVGPDHWGRYFDTLVPVGDRWLFQHRTARVEGFAAGGWGALNS